MDRSMMTIDSSPNSYGFGSLVVAAALVLIVLFFVFNERVKDKEITSTKRHRQTKPLHKRKYKRLKRKKKTDKKKEKDVNDIQERSKPSVIIAMDCEMVGTGRRGMNSMLARCSLVTVHKHPDGTNQISCIYDKYVKPTRNVTDYRTQWSGITPELLKSDGVVPFEVCQSQVRNILRCTEDRNVILVGHALENDFEVLKLSHPKKYTRDTSFYKPFMQQVRKKKYSRKLSHLVKEHLEVDIQQNDKSNMSIPVHIDKNNEHISSSEHHTGHSSIEDASAALLLYLKYEKEWEESLLKSSLREINDT